MLFFEHPLLYDLLNEYRFLFTFCTILIIWLIRAWIVIGIRGDDSILSEQQRKWMSRTKNGSFLIILLVIFLIWRSEINEFALSLTAIAVAIVVASKEIILCFTGYIERASSQSFDIGDWIEVGTLSGEVIDHNLMATKVQEIDNKNNTYVYTGKTVTLPNSLFFSTPVKNLNFMKRYVYHEFSITLKTDTDYYAHLLLITDYINHIIHDFYDIAVRYNHMIERRAGVDLPGAEPYVYIRTTELGDQQIIVRIFCPTSRAVELEQTVRHYVMQLYQTLKKEQERDKEP